jgi:outer membrane protein
MLFVRNALAILAFAFVLGAGSASAQATPLKPQPQAPQPAAASGTKAGFINVQALLRGMPGYAQAESTWTKDAESANGEAQKLRAVFDSSVAQYQQQQALMTASARTAKERALQAQGDSLQAKLQQLQARVGTKERELLGPLQERLKAIIDGVRAEGNYVMIIDLSSDAAAAIVSYDKSADITLRVAQRLAQGQSN